MIDLENISPIGFGGYRISIKHPQHFQTLTYGIQKGINLIDTASNYTNGESEALIGKYFHNYPNNRAQIFLITKAGYLGGDNLVAFESQNTEQKIPHITMRKGLKYCIHPDYLKLQIQTSLKRLNTDYLDCFLLHNPEHLFRSQRFTAKEVYEAIELAFIYLEELKQLGVIRYYGVSSNTLPTPNMPNGISLDRLLSISKNISKNNGFKFIQFPFNLAENEASETKQKEHTLIELANENGIKTLSNRPLNAFHEGKILRLAHFPIPLSKTELDEKDLLAFQEFITALSSRIKEIDPEADIFDFTPIKTLQEHRKQFENEGAVFQFYRQHLAPLLSVIFDNEIPQHFSDCVNTLRNYSVFYAKFSSNKKLQMYKVELLQKGILTDSSTPLPLAACQIYLDKGVDHVLMGLRKNEYVDQMLPLL